MSAPAVLVILAEGFEEIEAIGPIDLLRRAGAEVVVAAVGTGMEVKGRSGIQMRADVLFEAVRLRPFDLVFLPGGPGVKHLRANPQVLEIIQQQNNACRWLAAICAAPLVLKDAGLLHERRFTAHASAMPELPGCLEGVRTVSDAHLLTSRGAGTAVEFGLLLVEKLFSAEKAHEIGRSIHA